jgi:hypothetical protein
MSRHSASLLRKDLYLEIKPPIFTEEIARFFVMHFGVPEDLADLNKIFLRGRPFVAKLFVEAYRDYANGETKLDTVALCPMLINRVVEKLVNIFKNSFTSQNTV